MSGRRLLALLDMVRAAVVVVVAVRVVLVIGRALGSSSLEAARVSFVPSIFILWGEKSIDGKDD